MSEPTHDMPTQPTEPPPASLTDRLYFAVLNLLIALGAPQPAALLEQLVKVLETSPTLVAFGTQLFPLLEKRSPEFKVAVEQLAEKIAPIDSQLTLLERYLIERQRVELRQGESAVQSAIRLLERARRAAPPEAPKAPYPPEPGRRSEPQSRVDRPAPAQPAPRPGSFRKGQPV